MNDKQKRNKKKGNTTFWSQTGRVLKTTGKIVGAIVIFLPTVLGEINKRKNNSV